MSAMTATAEMKSNKPLAGAQVGIPPRRMDFDFDPAKTTRYYYDNNPFLSSFMTALSALFPEGESFFVEAVRAYRDQITDPKLKAEVSGFIGQEAMHSKEHEAFNQAATAQGYPVEQMDKELAVLLGLGQKILPKSVQLAITVSLEHYTAIIAEMLLRDEDIQKKFSPDMFKLWAWHALEENEHKNVAYDVYEKLEGGYLLRTGTMIPVTAIFFAVVFSNHARLLAADGQLFKFRQNWEGLKYCWNGRKGVFSRLLPKYLDFFKPSFHPSQHDTDALLAAWRDTLFADGGILADQIKKPGNQRKH